MRAIVLWCVLVAASSAVLFADDHSVIFDEDVEFSTFRTFAMSDGRMTSERPELNFPAVMRALGEAIHAALTASGLKESSDKADLLVRYQVTGVDYGVGPAGRANVIRPGRGTRGGRGSALQVDFTEATLVIDLLRADSAALLWRGVFHDTENDAATLGKALPKDASRLLAGFPPKRK